ncbi:hypothetical protein M422DRAFT_210039 [Sphaerobolus stellatus SS14]|uniref:Rhodanese domain-containing protein n=1 Tax=Sphaerobolus stellatus (strain SS14) TaxID=990650 RepID=A0A0C9VPT5_SPHS4|nr:hypothetical protein M422DRAFT_210039 [Sphaerobolus stellatus SS14]
MSSRQAPLLVTPSEVSNVPNTVFVDATWVMPNVPRKPREEYDAFRIPRARFLDIDEVATHSEEGKKLGLKHMMPSGELFAKACENLGISRDSHVVLYDSHGLFSSPRALYMFRAFSHVNSSVLNGGLPRWVDEGYPIESGPLHGASSTSGKYPVPELNKDAVRSYSQMVNNSNLPASDPTSELVIDARSRGRYLGTDPEPRPIPSGHIPNSFSLPFNVFTESHEFTNTSFLQSHPAFPFKSYTTLRPPTEINAELTKAVGPVYAESILEGERKVVATCGSGMTAAVLWIGLSSVWEARGRQLPTLGIYDESWTGYASRKESKIATGEQ